jgi:hypothetical protein
MGHLERCGNERHCRHRAKPSIGQQHSFLRYLSELGGQLDWQSPRSVPTAWQAHCTVVI